ncbi:hypothetical protein D9613_006266 [Agrocybe pediades]|uniref:TATA box binding protein associated factor (TAF) histone-like fold domain-containing protein n=1 Tax=Agrocybe pediades TaxID=84607 RepID=A0A8H4VPW8_9AGAR|nr:hypothetical protein D9613_006266 [Agrocybe pediades]
MMQTPTTKPAKASRSAYEAAHAGGVFKVDSIKDIAESLGLTISDLVASSLASDVEYRLNQVIEEAARFMRHGRRTTLTTSDIEQALRVLNIEPLYGHSAYNPTTFRRALPFSSSSQQQMGSSSNPMGGTSSGSQNPLGASNSNGPGPVYFPEDEEIDFDRVLREEKIALPKGPSWTAHWLAVEGVQPLIPENPPAVPREGDGDPLAKGDILAKAGVNGAVNGAAVNGSGINGTGTNGLLPGATAAKKPIGTNAATQHQQNQQIVKQVLSRELQLYYARLTSSLLPPPSASGSTPSASSISADFAKRTAALTSLRHDAGLQALLPYLVRWVGEGVVGALKAEEGTMDAETQGRTLEVLLDVISAILDNTTLFVEPYLHQILPPILSILLHSALPTSHTTLLRTTASQTLSKLLTQHSTTYPSLSPRIMKTLLLALISGNKSVGTREGAIRGLVGVGKEAVRKGLVEGGGARVVGGLWERSRNGMHDEDMEGMEGLVDSVTDALRSLKPSSSQAAAVSSMHMMDTSSPLDPNANEADAEVYEKLTEVLGEFFARQVASASDGRAWAREVLGMELVV